MMKAVIGTNTWVAENATVRGNVIVGRNCSIWFGAVVRAEQGSIRIGSCSNVQDNSVVHTDPGHNVEIGNGVTIGHMTVVHGCTIGDNTLVGMGAIVMNGAQVGRNCIIGAGTLVTQGMVIPDDSLAFGCPAKVVRKLRPEEIAGNETNAQHYVEISQAYLRGEYQ